MIRAICYGYRSGFAGCHGDMDLPFDVEATVARMIDEMGVDRYMEETLRVVDQREMRREDFEFFLIARGFSREAAAATPRGDADIVAQTGPHLGGFNRAGLYPGGGRGSSPGQGRYRPSDGAPSGRIQPADFAAGAHSHDRGHGGGLRGLPVSSRARLADARRWRVIAIRERSGGRGSTPRKPPRKPR